MVAAERVAPVAGGVQAEPSRREETHVHSEAGRGSHGAGDLSGAAGGRPRPHQPRLLRLGGAGVCAGKAAPGLFRFTQGFQSM
eukprot:1178973-Prorocentrum_minimum.AAC.5